MGDEPTAVHIRSARTDITPPTERREWISIEDPTEARTWLFDVTFLAGRWTCIWGQGCGGIGSVAEENSHAGCCSQGAWLSDEADRVNVERSAGSLSTSEWQRATRPGVRPSGLIEAEPGSWRTQTVDGACVFLNDPDHPGGSGCAFHLAATDRGLPATSLKPEVCRQVPIRREDHLTETGHVYTMVRAWLREDWAEGGADMAWWCVDSPEAQVGEVPVYRALEHELREITGPTVHAWLVDSLVSRQEARRRTGGPDRR
ncbi:MAG TPA: hypothetical protein ENI86_07105 [Acidimicrobiales bacterium]|nr:hypothetical protein [Acidimicrobiales bacterium]